MANVRARMKTFLLTDGRRVGTRGGEHWRREPTAGDRVDFQTGGICQAGSPCWGPAWHPFGTNGRRASAHPRRIPHHPAAAWVRPRPGPTRRRVRPDSLHPAAGRQLAQLAVLERDRAQALAEATTRNAVEALPRLARQNETKPPPREAAEAELEALDKALGNPVKPVAAVVGLTVTGAGLSQLMANASRGSRFDPSANRLEWWQNRTRKYPGDSGSIAIDQIARIRITRDDDRNEISLYGHDGERLHFFDTEVIHWNIDRWAEQARSAAPWIALEEVDRTHRPPRKG